MWPSEMSEMPVLHCNPRITFQSELRILGKCTVRNVILNGRIRKGRFDFFRSLFVRLKALTISEAGKRLEVFWEYRDKCKKFILFLTVISSKWRKLDLSILMLN